jgi:hypothetical protein
MIFFVTYEWVQYASVLVPGRIFKHSLMFANKVGANHRVDHIGEAPALFSNIKTRLKKYQALKLIGCK